MNSVGLKRRSCLGIRGGAEREAQTVEFEC